MHQTVLNIVSDYARRISPWYVLDIALHRSFSDLGLPGKLYVILLFALLSPCAALQEA